MKLFQVVKKTLPVLWLIALYTGTIMSAGVSNTPEGFWERVAFELMHAAVHFSLFAVMFWLTSTAATSAWLDSRSRTLLVLFGAAALLGLAQEWIQTYLRGQLYAVNSLWDIAMDSAGAWYGWRLVARRQHSASAPGLSGEASAHLKVQTGED